MADGTGFLPFGPELVVDGFAGHGGASTGLAHAYRHPDVAINHNAVAIAVHRVNHPNTKHHTCDIFEVDPLEATGGQPVAAAWFSPDCRHHSKAAGGKPRSKRVRGLAWVVVKWAANAKPRVIFLENVEEFQDWGPLLPSGQPDPAKKGKTFRHWVARLRNLGYVVEWRELVAADYGAPTIRKRLYVIARCDGKPITWPKPTHAKDGAGGLRPWRSAAECIDWTIQATSIFERKRPLVRNTCKRIAKGAWRYVLNTDKPFVVPLRGTSASHTSTHDIDAPLSTISAGGTHHALVQPVVAPYLTEHANAGNQRVFPAQEPLRTQCANVKGGHFALVSAFLEQAAGGPNSNTSRPRAMTEPVSTITASGSQQRLVTAYFVKYYGTDQDPRLAEPLHTVTTKDRFGLVQCLQMPADALTPEQRFKAKRCADFLHEHLPEHFPACDAVLVGGLVLVDFTLRMLSPRELARAQSFPDSYDIEHGLFETFRGSGIYVRKAISKTEQVRGIGNSVCPVMAEALAGANLADLIAHYSRQAA